MPHDPEKYLFDGLDSYCFLTDFVAKKTLDNLKTDRGFRSAVERELQFIGEAVFQLVSISPNMVEPISEHQRIIGFRHILVHAYDLLDHDLV